MDREGLILYLFTGLAFGCMIMIVMALATQHPKPEVRYLFKPEPDEIHQNSDEKCYAWKFESPMGWKKMIRICEEL